MEFCFPVNTNIFLKRPYQFPPPTLLNYLGQLHTTLPLILLHSISIQSPIHCIIPPTTHSIQCRPIPFILLSFIILFTSFLAFMLIHLSTFTDQAVFPVGRILSQIRLFRLRHYEWKKEVAVPVCVVVTCVEC